MKDLPQYYRVVRAFLKNGSSLPVWRASDGEVDMYTIHNTNILLKESDIADWTDWEEYPSMDELIVFLRQERAERRGYSATKAFEIVLEQILPQKTNDPY